MNSNILIVLGIERGARKSGDEGKAILFLFFIFKELLKDAAEGGKRGCPVGGRANPLTYYLVLLVEIIGTVKKNGPEG